MPYAVQADLNLSTERLIELTDTAAAPGVIDTTLTGQLLTESQGIVDAYLAGSIPVPFADPVPAIIRAITSWIWAYRIYRHREVMDIPKSVLDDYAMALSLLEKLAVNGAPALGLTVSSVPSVVVGSNEPRGWNRSVEDSE